MKNKIGIILVIIFFLLISLGNIILSIHILEREITDLEEYIYAIIMLVTGVFTLSVMIVLSLVLLIKKIKCNR